MELVKVYTDGGAQPNPGIAGCGVVIDTGSKVIHSCEELGVRTNNEAEYLGFLHALDLLKLEGIKNRHIVFYADSQLAVMQLSSVWKIREPRLQVLYNEFHCKLKALECTASFEAVKREKNKMADALARQAIDKQKNSGQ